MYFGRAVAQSRSKKYGDICVVIYIPTNLAQIHLTDIEKSV